MTSQQLATLLRTHSSEISAQNAMIQILNELVTSGTLTSEVTLGNTETPLTVEDVYVAVSNETGATTEGVKSFSIMFEGTGGKLNGVPVVSGYVNSKTASLGNTLGSENYTIPTAGDTNFPTPRVVISYTS